MRLCYSQSLEVSIFILISDGTNLIVIQTTNDHTTYLIPIPQCLEIEFAVIGPMLYVLENRRIGSIS